MMSRLFFTWLLIITSFFSVASIQVYQFNDVKKEQQFNSLVQELRCPKCQNNNLADSNSALSVDLKEIIFEKVIAGETDDQIIDYLKARYGDFISYRPPVKPSTWFIWFGPFVFLAVGGLAIFRFLSVRKKPINDIQVTNTSKASQDLLAQWNDELVNETENNQQGAKK